MMGKAEGAIWSLVGSDAVVGFHMRCTGSRKLDGKQK